MMAAFAEICLGVVSQKTRHQRNSRARMFSERRRADDLNLPVRGGIQNSQSRYPSNASRHCRHLGQWRVESAVIGSC